MSSSNSVLICGFYGNHNLGDEAMLSGMIKLLSKNEKPSVTVFSNDPNDTHRRHGVGAIHISKRRCLVNRLYENFCCRTFILGGGDLLRDSPYSSVALNWMKYLQPALALKRYTGVVGISVGEIWRDETKEAIPKILNQVQLIAVRDEQSRNRLEELGVKQEIHVIGDLALYSVSTQPSKTNHNSKFAKPLRVGISVRHLVGRGKSVDPKIYDQILKEIINAADFLVDNYQATIHFLPLRTLKDSYHCIDDDYVSSLEALRFSRYNSQAITHRYFDNAQEFAEKIQELDLVIGMRLHSLILSSLVGTPVIGIAYDTKVSAFMKEIQQENNCISLDKTTAEEIINKAVKIIQNPHSSRIKLSEGTQLYRQKLFALDNKIFDL